jgi:NTE family protein
MNTALVLSAGGMWTAWEAGAWSVLRHRFQPDLIVGASAGAWVGWCIAGGCEPEELIGHWLDPRIGGLMRFGIHGTGIFRPEALFEQAQDLFERFRPKIPFALTIVELPFLRSRIVRDSEVTWRHLAAACAIPFGFPPVEIDGKRYVDGGLRAGLPLWAAEELGARRAIALNVLNTRVFRLLHRGLRGRRASPALEVIRLEPSERLGSLRDAVQWQPDNIRRWIALGERDAMELNANHPATLSTM